MAPAPEPRIEALGDHEYLVHISMDDDSGEAPLRH